MELMLALRTKSGDVSGRVVSGEWIVREDGLEERVWTESVDERTDRNSIVGFVYAALSYGRLVSRW